jgi:integrase
VAEVRSKSKQPGMHADGGGLYLQVTKAGVPSWVFRFLPAGAQRERYMGLGPLHTITLAEARERARECRKFKLDGGDPIEARRAARAAVKVANAKTLTFKACAEAYIRDNAASWKNPKHAAQWPSTLDTYVYPVFGDLPVQEIDTGLVTKAIRPIWAEKPETASRVRGRIEAILDWATVSGHRQGENPARWKGHLDKLLPKKNNIRPVEHHAALSYDKLGTFMVELREQRSITARALEFAILTAARTGEVIGATWGEIDLKQQRLWVVPASRMKAKREHRVPLSEPPNESRGRHRL